MKQTQQDLKLVFKVKENDKYKTLGTIEELNSIINSILPEEINYLNKELKLNKIYNFKREGYIKNECLLKLREFVNG